MTDRELLELAAKAAGIDYDPDKSKPHPVNGAFWGLWLIIKGEPYEGQRCRWKPLTDDGDALRLAVALNLDVLQEPVSSKSNAVEVVANIEGIEFQPWAWENRAPDPYAATRRAIVRAAAEIGRLTKE